MIIKPHLQLTTDTNYADDALMHLQSGDYETVMMIPAVDKADLSKYVIAYGDLDTMKTQIKYATTWEYGVQVYGVPSTATTQGIVYNKKVVEEAGAVSYTHLKNRMVISRPLHTRTRSHQKHLNLH